MGKISCITHFSARSYSIYCDLVVDIGNNDLMIPISVLFSPSGCLLHMFIGDTAGLFTPHSASYQRDPRSRTPHFLSNILPESCMYSATFYGSYRSYRSYTSPLLSSGRR
jgi:hypothetical protein